MTPDARQDPLRHRRLRRHDRDPARRHPAAGAQEDRPLQVAPGARRDGRHGPGGALLPREPPLPPRQAVRPRGAQAESSEATGRGRHLRHQPGHRRRPGPDRQIDRGAQDLRRARGRGAYRGSGQAGRRDAAQEATEPLATKPKPCARCSRTSSARSSRSSTRSQQDELFEAGASEEAKEKAKALVSSFEAFLEEHKDEIDALQFFYASPTRSGCTSRTSRLAEAIKAPPRSWTPEKLWRAYELLTRTGARGASERRLLDGHRLAGALRPAQGRGAGTVQRAGARTVRALAGAAARPGAASSRRAGAGGWR